MATRLQRSPRLRHLLGTVHLWIGLALCLPLALLGLTGSLLVFEPELTTWLDPPPRASARGPSRPIAELVAAARRATPSGYVPAFFSPPPSPDGAATVRLAERGRPGPGGMQVFVDPTSAAVLATRDPSQGVLRRVFMLHANLMMLDRSGREIVGYLGIVMTVLGASGLVLWWPAPGRWRRAFTVDGKSRGFRLMRELHGTAGIWGLVVFLTVSVSGVYLAFPQTVGGAIASVLPARDLRPAAMSPRVTPIEGAQPLDVDGAVALAASEFPGTVLRFVVLPQRPDQPFRVLLTRPGQGDGTPGPTVIVDPWTRGVVGRLDPQTYSAGEAVMAWQHAVHAGAAFGWPWRILVFVSGLLPALFAATGSTMWLLRRRAAARRRVVALGGAE